MKLPLKPAIKSEVGGSGPEHTITLRSPVLARDVYLSFGDLNVTLSDNYFDLLPERTDGNKSIRLPQISPNYSER